MKKSVFTILCFVLYTASISAQAPIPNQGFESWSGNTPNSWGTSDGIFAGLGQSPGNITKETNGADVYAGTSSVKIKTDSVTISLLGQTFLVPGVVSLGSLSLNLFTQSLDIKGIGYTSRPDSFSLAYKYNSGNGGNDTATAILTLTKAIPGSLNGRKIIANSIIKLPPSASYTVIDAKVEYQSLMTPDTLYVQLISSNIGGFGGGQPAGPGGFGAGVAGSTLWADDLQFRGEDTAFKAYITPRFDRTICEGDIVSMESDDLPGFTFQWLKDGTPINGQNQFYYDADSTGAFSVIVSNGLETDTSDVVNVVVNPLPVVTLNGNPDNLCNNASAITLTGGSPAGGDYSGTGVNNGVFTPSDASLGNNTITYTYTDNNRCSAEATEVINLTNCSSITEIAEGYQLSVYPNPASDVLYVANGENFKGTQLNITDAMGRVVYTTTITDLNHVISTSGFATGQYFLQVIGNSNNTIVKGRITIKK